MASRDTNVLVCIRADRGPKGEMVISGFCAQVPAFSREFLVGGPGRPDFLEARHLKTVVGTQESSYPHQWLYLLSFGRSDGKEAEMNMTGCCQQGV